MALDEAALRRHTSCRLRLPRSAARLDAASPNPHPSALPRCRFAATRTQDGEHRLTNELEIGHVYVTPRAPALSPAPFFGRTSRDCAGGGPAPGGRLTGDLGLNGIIAALLGWGAVALAAMQVPAEAADYTVHLVTEDEQGRFHFSGGCLCRGRRHRALRARRRHARREIGAGYAARWSRAVARPHGRDHLRPARPPRGLRESNAARVTSSVWSG